MAAICNSVLLLEPCFDLKSPGSDNVAPVGYAWTVGIDVVVIDIRGLGMCGKSNLKCGSEQQRRE